jgi:hypothetical protein
VVSAALIAAALAAGSAVAQSPPQSADTIAGPPGPRLKHKLIDLDVDALSFDFTQDIAKFLNDFHDKYRGYKKEITRDYDLQYSLLVSIFPQWAVRNGGPGVVQLAYDPNVIWSPFKNTAVGSEAFRFLNAANPVLDQGYQRIAASPVRPDHPTQQSDNEPASIQPADVHAYIS